MNLPKSAIFAFNANIDHVKSVTEEDLKKIDQHFPVLHNQLSECFAWGVQREIQIDPKICAFLLSGIKYDYKTVGGQAGNAAQQASALGIDCSIHSNFANEELLSLFQHKERIFFPTEKGFVPAGQFSSSQRSAHHFVFEDPQSRTRFIASFDPVPMHLEDNFIQAIGSVLPTTSKAFVGGLHLAKTPDRLKKFVDEIVRWKKINPALQVFLELGEFQNDDVRQAAREIAFPAADMVGLSDTDLASFGCELDELAGNPALLYHSPGKQRVLPEDKTDEAALEFAKKAATFLAKEGRFGNEQEILASDGASIATPKRLVGLGDCFSSAYFMASQPQ